MVFKKPIHFIFISISVLALNAAAGPFDPNQMIDLEKMRPKGKWEEVTWPDTLDLAERARLAVNALTGNQDPATCYFPYAAFKIDVNPPLPYAPQFLYTCWYLNSLPFVRTMSGSDQNLEAEANLMRVTLENIRADGMMYWPVTADWPKDTSMPQYNGLTAVALLNWYQRDHNPKWIEAAGLLCEGLNRIAIRKEDRAYYPLECGYKPDGTWNWTTRGGFQFIPYNPPNEPEFDMQGHESDAKWFVATGPMAGIVAYWKQTGDRKYMDLARRLTRFSLKPGMWEHERKLEYPQNEHGIHYGHPGGNAHYLCYLFDFALAENDEWLKQFVREGYDWFIQNSIIRIGYGWGGSVEPDFISYLLALGVRMSDAGIGDYWDDVDAIIRNQLTEQQFTDFELMRELSGNDPKNDALLKRWYGGFSVTQPTVMWPEVMAGNIATGPAGYYYAWHGITRFDRGVATVNLFLNRVSPWMDVASWIPYEGRVVLTNKQAHTAVVRIPRWVDIGKIECSINGKSMKPARAGNRLIFRKLNQQDKIELHFPIPEATDQYRMEYKLVDKQLIKQNYTIHWRGSTVMNIEPRDTVIPKMYNKGKVYPMYRREHFKATQAPMHTVKRFVADDLLPLN